MYLLDLVAGDGDALGDALVRLDGRGELGIVLNYQLVQIPVTRLKGLLQTALLRFPVLHIIAVGQSPAQNNNTITIKCKGLDGEQRPSGNGSCYNNRDFLSSPCINIAHLKTTIVKP